MAKPATTFEQRDKDELIHHIHMQNGNVVQIAKATGCTRQGIYSKIRRWSLWHLVEKIRKAA